MTLRHDGDVSEEEEKEEKLWVVWWTELGNVE